MSEPFIAEIRIFAGNFAPRGWAFCNGQLLPVSQNTALFSLIGTTYGGDGRTTTALPNLEGRAPMHPGRGPGLTARRLGEKVGSETVNLNETQMPNHTHPLRSFPAPGNASDASSHSFARTVGAAPYLPSATLADMATEAIEIQGTGATYNEMQPFLVLNFIIALVGLYPSRS